MQQPNTNSIWSHQNGNLYRVICVTNTNSDEARSKEYPVSVTYQEIKSGMIWSKEIGLWLAKRTLVYDTVDGFYNKENTPNDLFQESENMLCCIKANGEEKLLRWQQKNNAWLTFDSQYIYCTMKHINGWKPLILNQF